MNKNETPTVLFDGYCYLCSGLARFLKKMDKSGTFRLIPLQGEDAREITQNLEGHKPDPDTIILVDSEGVHLKSQAVFRIVRHLSGFWKAILIFSFLPQGFNDWLYDFIARNRYKIFGKRKECMIID